MTVKSNAQNLINNKTVFEITSGDLYYKEFAMSCNNLISSLYDLNDIYNDYYLKYYFEDFTKNDVVLSNNNLKDALWYYLEKLSQVTYLYEFKNFAYTNPMFCLAFLISLLGLAGMPLTSGFIAKVYLLSAIAQSGLIFLPFLIILVCAIVVSLYYYVRIAKLMFEKDKSTEEKYVIYKTESASIVLYACSIITVIIGILPNQVIELCKLIAYNI